MKTVAHQSTRIFDSVSELREPHAVEKTAALIATFLGVGKAPKAPGTFGTLATIPLALLLNWAGPFYMMGFVLLLLPAAVWAAGVHAKNLGKDDPGEIVIDEVWGFLITMTWLPMTWQAYLLGFLLFRLLDITKPLLIGYLDRNLSGGLGVMADDIAAGVFANLILQILYVKTAWLGVQIL
jgi:phosphatidylglycerophosphatase A